MESAEASNPGTPQLGQPFSLTLNVHNTAMQAQSGHQIMQIETMQNGAPDPVEQPTGNNELPGKKKRILVT